MKNTIHLISGATAVGKTGFSLRYAKENNAEIISCDASLVYKGMNIGTAKPTKEELNRIRHYCIDLRPVDKPFDVRLYNAYAKNAVKTILNKGKSIVVAGGSGFYLKSFFEPILDTVNVSKSIRNKSERLFLKGGLNGLIEALKIASPEGLGNLDILNPRRVQRALERCWASGKSLPELQSAFLEKPKPYEHLEKKFIYLERDTDELKKRIELRAEKMLENGLIDEVKTLLSKGIEKNPNAANAIGYRETIAFLKGSLVGNALLPEIIKNTKRLVRKQKTWFRTQLPQADQIINMTNIT